MQHSPSVSCAPHLRHSAAAACRSHCRCCRPGERAPPGGSAEAGAAATKVLDDGERTPPGAGTAAEPMPGLRSPPPVIIAAPHGTCGCHKHRYTHTHTGKHTHTPAHTHNARARARANTHTYTHPLPLPPLPSNRSRLHMSTPCCGLWTLQSCFDAFRYHFCVVTCSNVY